jgi:hypothetical protein
MTFQLTGTPSDEMPEVLATGVTDAHMIFASFSARDPQGRDAEYLQWHSLDHRPEQHRLRGIRQSLRVVSTPACRDARACSDPRYDAVDHLMTYFMTADAAFTELRVLSDALMGARRPLQLPSVASGYFRLAGKVAARRAIAGADVIPWRPSRGIYLLVEQGTESPAPLVDVDGVAGIWWHRGGKPPDSDFPDNSGLQLSYCFLDADPVETAARLRRPLEQRWTSGKSQPWLAAPFYTLVPFEWQRYLP